MGLASLPGLGAQTHFVPTDDKTEVGHSEGPPASSNTLLRGQGSPEEEQVLGDNRTPQAAARPPHDTYSHVGRGPLHWDPPAQPEGPVRGPSCACPWTGASGELPRAAAVTQGVRCSRTKDDEDPDHGSFCTGGQPPRDRQVDKGGGGLLRTYRNLPEPLAIPPGG